MKKLLCTVAAILGLAMPIGAQAQDQSDSLDVTMIIFTIESAPFYIPLVNGAELAAERNNINLDVQYARVDAVRQNNLIETAIANGVDGLLVSIWDDNAFDDVLCEAMANGTPVIGFNIDDSEGAQGTCRMAFIGQDFEATGYRIAKRMIEEHGIGQGDKVYTPVEFPEAVYAVGRHAGVQRALDEVGATGEIHGVTDTPSETLTFMTQYLIGNNDIKAIIGLGSIPMMMSQQAMDDTGVNVPVGGFDVGEEVLAGIENGRITATVDQQPYQQGFYAVQQMAHYLRYGILPADMNTGGSGLLDNASYKSAVDWAGVAR